MIISDYFCFVLPAWFLRHRFCMFTIDRAFLRGMGDLIVVISSWFGPISLSNYENKISQLSTLPYASERKCMSETYGNIG